MKKVFVSDFTLRQSDRDHPALSFREKTAMAKCLDSLGVDAVELAAVKNGREDSIVSRTLAATLKNTGVCIPAGFSEEEVDAAWACVMEAARPCLQVIVPTSTVQMEYLHHMKADKMCQRAASLPRARAGRWSSSPRMPPGRNGPSWWSFAGQPSRRGPTALRCATTRAL